MSLIPNFKILINIQINEIKYIIKYKILLILKAYINNYYF